VTEKYRVLAEHGRLGTSLFATLRGPECTWDDLRESVETLLGYAGQLFHVRGFPGTGLIAYVDFTRLDEYRLHPHLHLIVHVQKSYYNSRRYWSSELWAEVWGEISGVWETGTIKIRKVDDVSGAARYSLSLTTKDDPGKWTVDEPMRFQTLLRDVRTTRAYGDLRGGKTANSKKQAKLKAKGKAKYMSKMKPRVEGDDRVGGRVDRRSVPEEAMANLISSGSLTTCTEAGIRHCEGMDQVANASDSGGYAESHKERFEHIDGIRTGKSRAFRVRVGRLPVYQTNEKIESAVREFWQGATWTKQYQRHQEANSSVHPTPPQEAYSESHYPLDCSDFPRR
jgi:hypothetical protein